MPFQLTHTEYRTYLELLHMTTPLSDIQKGIFEELKQKILDVHLQQRRIEHSAFKPKKGRKKHKWDLFVEDYRKNNPSVSFKDALKICSVLYRKMKQEQEQGVWEDTPSDDEPILPMSKAKKRRIRKHKFKQANNK